jgi:Co/Zn/Cd efflux system component
MKNRLETARAQLLWNLIVQNGTIYFWWMCIFPHSHRHPHHSEHDHSHGAVDRALLTTNRGIWAVKWSLIGLAATALFQLIVFFFSGSIALLADTIHNMADAGTAIPLWVAFTLARRPPSRRFTYGLGRVEDVAGIVIVLTILFSAVLAGYESIAPTAPPAFRRESLGSRRGVGYRFCRQ